MPTLTTGAQLQFLKDGGEMGELTRNFDWTKTSLGTPAGWPQSLRTTLSIILNSRFPMFLFWGPEHICFYNDAYRPSLGNEGKHPGILGMPGKEAWPEIWDFIGPMIDKVQSGEGATWYEDQFLPIYRNGQMEDVYWTFSYSPVSDESGETAGVFVTCTETTKAVKSVAALRESEQRFQNLLRDATVGLVVMKGEDMVVATANAAYCKIIGHNLEETLNRPVFEVIPDAEAYFRPILQEVRTTGAPFSMNDAPYHVRGADGAEINGFVSFVYMPYREADGTTTGVMAVVQDVTEQILAYRKVAAGEEKLKIAMELAELATWQIDLQARKVTYSPRLQEWLGVPERSLSFDASPLVHERDREKVRAAFEAAFASGGTGMFDEVYTIINVKNGQHRIIHSSGKAEFDAEGKPLSISGISQDVTMQQELRLALENEVQQHTEQLAAAVENLSTANAELQHSNDELAQYAYVASHDLQEPLRKIRVFSGMLKSGRNMPESSQPTIEKINQSAERMSYLIQDLLEFSRLLKSDTLMRPVALGDAVHAVWSDFELMVEEKRASLQVGALPVIQAVNLQINQLFYNLISNALKFSVPGRAPEIRIDSRPVSGTELTHFISKPLPFSSYHHITVSDNGIGFETQYNDQIFEVFKRLHGRDMYPGSGIGLALCRRIAANHHGALFAESEIGKGSIFHIILPQRQHETVSDFSADYAAFPTTN